MSTHLNLLSCQCPHIPSSWSGGRSQLSVILEWGFYADAGMRTDKNVNRVMIDVDVILSEFFIEHVLFLQKLPTIQSFFYGLGFTGHKQK